MNNNNTSQLYNIGFAPKPLYVADHFDEDKTRAVVQVRRVSWAKLVKLAEEIQPITNKHKAPYVIFAKFNPDDHARPKVNSTNVKYAFRNNASVEHIEGLTLDLDDCPLSFEQLQKNLVKRKLKYILFTTYSFNPDDPDNDRRFRIIVPLDSAINVEDQRAAGLGLAKALSLPPKSVDLSSLVISQPSYLRACPIGSENKTRFCAAATGNDAPATKLIEKGTPFLDDLGVGVNDEDKRSGAKLIRDLKAGRVGVGDRHGAFGKYIAECKNNGWTREETFKDVDRLNSNLSSPLPDDQVDGLERFWLTFERNDNAFSYVELAERVDDLLEYKNDKKKLEHKTRNVLKMMGNSVAQKSIYRKSKNGVSAKEVEFLLVRLSEVLGEKKNKTYWKSEIHTQKQKRISEHERKKQQQRDAKQLENEEVDIEFDLIREEGGTSPRFPLNQLTRLDANEKRLFPDIVLGDEDEDGYQTVRLQVTLDNFEYFLKAYGIDLSIDIFKKEGTAKLNGESIEGGRDAYVNTLSIINRNDFKGWKEVLPDFMAYMGWKNTYNPIEDWLDTLEYKGTGHIDELADCVTVATAEEDRIKHIVFKRWLIQACAAANMCKDTLNYEAKPIYGYVVVLQGVQGTDKSKFFRALLPEKIANEYLRTGVHYDHKDKDSLSQVVSSWLVELEELDTTFSRTETGAIKQFLTREKDIWRAPYGRFTDKWPRCSVYWGSVNPADFLRDKTGNRRFWPLQVHGIILPDDPLAGIDIEAAWAEAWYLYLSGEQWWPTEEEEKLLEAYRLEKFSGYLEAPIEIALREKFGTFETILNDKEEFGVKAFTLSSIVDMLGFNHMSHDRKTTNIVRNWLDKHCVTRNQRGLLVPDKVKANGRGTAYKWRIPLLPIVNEYISLEGEP